MMMRVALVVLVLAAVIVIRPAQANPEPINVEYGPAYGRFVPVPSGRHNVIAWPVTSDAFPDSRGLMSPDRTEVTLVDAGTYLVTWRITFQAGDGQDRRTSLECFSDDWHACGDGNEMPPTRGQGIDGYGPNETTLVGFSWIRSDGHTRIRVLAQHDSDRPIKTTDRTYEQSLHVAAWVH